MTLSYDKAVDVLYITFEPAPPGSYLYVENDNGDVLRLDRNTRRVVGCTIMAFAQRCAKGRLVIPEVGAVPFNEIADNLVCA
jgi:uncharacterized protein YuzE